jgi:hypothetical protein
MPTNILRAANRARPKGRGAPSAAEGARHVLITAGAVSIRARLLDTPTAERIWQALPIRSTVETWGEEIFFETPVESGRERAARTIVAVGEIAFAPDRDVIAIAYGRTPATRKAEARLWSPSNVWAEAIDDVRALAAVRPGQRVDVTRFEGGPADG